MYDMSAHLKNAEVSYVHLITDIFSSYACLASAYESAIYAVQQDTQIVFNE